MLPKVKKIEFPEEVDESMTENIVEKSVMSSVRADKVCYFA